MKKTALLLFKIMLSYCSYPQEVSEKFNDSLFISISCIDAHTSDQKINIEGRIINLGKKNIYLPDRLIVGELNNIVTNIGYEILFCGSDTINISEQIILNINPGPPVKNIFKLDFLKSRNFKFVIPKSYLIHHGKYLIRCILKRHTSWFIENHEIKDSVSSDWFSFIY